MKYSKGFLIILCSVSIIFFLYLEFGGRFILNMDNKKEVSGYMQVNKKLPENFITFYNTVYPNSMSQNSWNFYLKFLTQSRPDLNTCPCHRTGNRMMPVLSIQNKSSLDYFLLIRYIEQNYSPEDCLNFNFSNFDFLNDRKGIEQISHDIFNKSAKELQPVEMAEILALYENSKKNDRYRNPEITKNRTAHFYNLYLSNLKK